MIRVFTLCMIALLAVGVGAQTVTVSGTPAAVGPVDFEFLGDALDSFIQGGANAGTPDDNIINITATVVSMAPGAYSFTPAAGSQENYTVTGTLASGGVATILVSQEAAGALDGFDWTADSNAVFTDLNFLPAAGNTMTDQLTTWDLVTATTVTLEFNNCYFGPNDGSDAPADRTGQTAGTVGVAVPDDSFVVFPDSGENVHLVLNDCVFHAGGGPDGDSAILAPAAGVNAGSLTMNNCVFSYAQRLGLQLGYDDPEPLRADGCIFYRNGQGAPASLGNGLFTTGGGSGDMEMTDCIAAQNHDRNISMNSGATVGDWDIVDGCIFSDTLGGAGLDASAVVSAPGAGVNLITITNTTFHNTNGDTCVFLGDDPVSMEGVIIAGDGGTENGITGGAPVTIVDSAIVLFGPNSVAGGVPPGYTATAVTETSTINADPVFIQTTNPFNADYFDVQNDQYMAQGIGGANLSGGGDFVGGLVPVELSVFSTN